MDGIFQNFNTALFSIQVLLVKSHHLSDQLYEIFLYFFGHEIGEGIKIAKIIIIVKGLEYWVIDNWAQYFNVSRTLCDLNILSSELTKSLDIDL